MREAVPAFVVLATFSWGGAPHGVSDSSAEQCEYTSLLLETKSEGRPPLICQIFCVIVRVNARGPLAVFNPQLRYRRADKCEDRGLDMFCEAPAGARFGLRGPRLLSAEVKLTMPLGAANSLPDETCADIVAFLLKANGAPPGNVFALPKKP